MPAGWLLASAVAITNTAIFLFQIMLARINTPVVFGEAIAVLALMLLLEAPTSTLQSLVSRTVQRNISSSDQPAAPVDFGGLVALSLLSGLILSGVLMAVIPLLSTFLRLSHPPYLLAAYSLPLLVGVVPKGVLSGLGDSRSMSLGLVTGGLIRLGSGTVLVHSGYGINGAIGAVVAGELCTALVLLNASRRRTGPVGSRLTLPWRDAVGEGAASTGFWVLSAVDVVVARHYLTPVDSGLYGASATMAQLVMILPLAGACLLFPRLAGRTVGSRGSRTPLLRGIVAVAASALIVAAVVRLAAGPLIHALFDVPYLDARRTILPLLLSAAALGVVTALVQYLLSRREAFPASLSWLAVAGFLVAVHVDHRSPLTIATEVMAASAATAALMLAVALHGFRYRVGPGDAVGGLSSLDAEVDLTVVVPYYNPGDALAPNLRRLVTVLDSSSATYEIVAVSDGSTDGSDVSITEVGADRVRHILLPRNQGKGAALRAGLLVGRGRYLGFIDADGDLDPQLLEAFVVLTGLYDPDVVVGSKRHPLSAVHYPPLRWVYSIGYQYLVRLLFRLNVRDTQTGIKLVRRDVLAATLPRMLEKRFAFDLELLVVARRLGHRRVLEAPVTLQHHFKSTISIRAVVNTLVDTLAIFYRLRFLRTYDRTPAPEESLSPLRMSSPFVRGGAGLGG